jgi:hypothetical protein
MQVTGVLLFGNKMLGAHVTFLPALAAFRENDGATLYSGETHSVPSWHSPRKQGAKLGTATTDPVHAGGTIDFGV